MHDHTLSIQQAHGRSKESVLFQPVLKVYPTCHSWIITAHVSLGNLEKKWRMFIRQMDKTQQLLKSLLQKPLAPTHLLSPLEAELTNLESIHMSYKPLILAANQLLKRKPSFNGVSVSTRCTWRSLLPFLGDALSWLTGTAMTKDVNSIKQEVNQLISTQHSQQETLVHVISILNVIRYATQVNRQHINIVMNAAEKTHQDVTTLYNLTHSLYSSLSYQQIVLHICSILANLRDSLYYMREVALHTMDYIDAATTGILSPHVLPVDRSQRNAITHWRDTTFNHAFTDFIRQCTSLLQIPMHPHLDCRWTVLITNPCTPIQDHTQLEIYEVFNLAIPHENFSACYSINNRYLGMTHDETKAVEISEDQFKTCQKANRQFCSLNTPLLLLVKPTNLYNSFIHQGQS